MLHVQVDPHTNAVVVDRAAGDIQRAFGSATFLTIPNTDTKETDVATRSAASPKSRPEKEREFSRMSKP